MIAFITIFLGLVAGTKPVEFAVSGTVSEVEVLLDGELVGRLTGEPWQLDCDFGEELTTHRLEAVARDAYGKELTRIEQLINVPRPHVDAQLLLENWQDGQPRSARLIWRSVEPIDPVSVSVTLDGEVLADRYQARYELPRLDSRSIHFLSARLEFPENLQASAEAVFGGIYGEATETELTAVPLVVAGRKLRRLERLQGRLVEDGEVLRLVALEDGPAEVILVRDRRALGRLRTLDSTYASRYDYDYASLKGQDGASVLSPRPYLSVHPDATRYSIFPVSAPVTRKVAPLPRLLAGLKFVASPVLPQQLIDAVAAAGQQAAASQKRRAVVLVTSNCAIVSGEWSPEVARRYLAQLRVPFRVWVVEKPARGEDFPAGGFCEGAQPIHSVRLFQTAIKRLRRDLLSQQIVWVEGRRLQRKIELVGDEPGVRLAE